MPGSRKGERRGGAKPGAFRKSAPKAPRPKKPGKAGRPPGVVAQGVIDPAEIGKILSKKRSKAEIEQDLEMYFTIVGKRMRLPKEVMLDAMRYFEEIAIDWGQVLQANMLKSAMAKTPEEIAVYESAVAGAENRLREYLTMAVDVAYKAAPYVHPRLAAMITNPGSAESPLNAIATLFRDIDEAGKPPRFIDHDASEIVK